MICTRRTLRTVLVTSIFWIIVQAFVLLSNICFSRPGFINPDGESVIIINEERNLPTHKLDKSSRFGNVSIPVFLTRMKNGQLYYHHDKRAYVVPEGLGEGGAKVSIPSHLKELADKMFKEHQFNLMASEIMSVNRSLQEVRARECMSVEFPKNLPNTSIVIVFHNEAWTTLLRTLHSVINRSPRHLIKEIVLVDDASIGEPVLQMYLTYVLSPKILIDHLGLPLEAYISQLPVPTHVLRMGNRSGLIRSRLRGAEFATGQTLTFLDAHVEASNGWLEPLLNEVRKDRTAVGVPLIDIINDHDFSYRAVTESEYGGFSWDLVFRWAHVSQREIDRRGGDPTLAIRSPTMAGGLFTIDRNYFYEARNSRCLYVIPLIRGQIGSYDEGMIIWGGENIEMSFRIWMCGGQIHMLPCSHVGHVFRKVSPYSWPGGVSYILHHNNMRIAKVWMDKHERFYTGMKPDATSVEFGDISKRVAFRKEKCPHSFQWYLKNVFPDSDMPSRFNSLGRVSTISRATDINLNLFSTLAVVLLVLYVTKKIRNAATDKCLDTLSAGEGKKAGVFKCHNSGNSQFWAHTFDGNLRNNKLCLEIMSSDPTSLYHTVCRPRKSNEFFIYRTKSQTFFNKLYNVCLGLKDGELYLSRCSNSPLQKWSVEKP